MLGLLEHVFTIIVHDHAARLATIGLPLNLSKTKCYINDQYRTPQYHTLRGDIAEGFNSNVTTGEQSRDLCVYGVPVGKDSFIETFLNNKGDKICSDLRLVGKRMNPQTITQNYRPANACGN